MCGIQGFTKMQILSNFRYLRAWNEVARASWAAPNRPPRKNLDPVPLRSDLASPNPWHPHNRAPYDPVSQSLRPRPGLLV